MNSDRKYLVVAMKLFLNRGEKNDRSLQLANPQRSQTSHYA